MEIKQHRSEKRAIEKFRRQFFDKFGHYPVVITSNTSVLPIIPLEELRDCIIPFAPGLCDKDRSRQSVDMRIIYCYLARNMDYKLQKIGSSINRDHSTVYRSVKIFDDLMESDENFRFKFHQVLESIKEKIGHGK